MPIRYMSFIGLFLIITCKVFSQNPAYFKIGEDEFSNTDIYALFYDEGEDVLYAGTNRGIYVYKQNKFRRLKKPKEQIGISIFSIKQNAKGEIFCKNLNGQIFKINDDSYSLFYQVPPDEHLTYFDYFIVNGNELLVGTSDYARLIDSSGVKTKIIPTTWQANLDGISRISTMSQVLDGTVYITSLHTEKVYTYHHNHLDSLSVKFNNAEIRSNFFELRNQILSISTEGNINVNSPKIHQNYIPVNRDGMSLFDEDELIGLKEKSGIHFLKYEGNILSEGQHFFDNQFISAFCKKKNGLLFFGTFGEGIYVIPDRNILTLTHEQLFLGITASPDNEVYLSTRAGEIYRYFDELTLLGTENASVDKVFSVYGDFDFKGIKTKGLVYKNTEDFNYAIKDIFQIDSSLLLVATISGVRVRKKNASTPVWNLDYISNIGLDYSVVSGSARINAICWSAKDSLIFYASKFGVFSKEWSTPTTNKIQFNGNHFMARDLAFYDDMLICATGDHGLLFYIDNVFQFQIAEADGLQSNTVKKIELKNNKLFILTTKGIQIYDLEQQAFIYVGIKEGVISKDISNFAVSETKLWLLETHRFYSIDFSKIDNRVLMPKLYIDAVTVGSKKIDHIAENIFNHNENTFSFYYDYRNIESKTETIIKYTLDGFYSDWKSTPTSENEIVFDYLPAGEYTFKIKAIYRGHETETFEYSFVIRKPYWQLWWFYVLGLVFISAVLAFIFYRRLKRQRLQAKLLNDLNTSKLTAIQSQMNPHFIFNALNSIQALVLRGDVEKSYAYINKFSKLIRKTLSFSEKKFIEFESEINLIDIYLTLEKLRFREDFEYTIHLPEDDEFMVSPMLIQPFIENALLHGLLHKEGVKTIDIHFEISDILTCTVIDNGIGRKEANEINKRQNPAHESFAIGALKNRLEILSKRHNQPIGFVYEDLYDANGKAIGTKVIIKIPILKNF